MHISIMKGDQKIDVLLRISLKAKRIIIKVICNRVELIVPKHANIKHAKDFLNIKKDWVFKRIKEIPIIKMNEIMIFGFIHEIAKYDGYKISLDKMIIYIPKNIFKVEIENFLYKKLLLKIISIANEFCDILKVKYNKISIKNVLTRWGSCSISKNLSFSYYLVHAPINVIRYVVAHEVSHLLHMNHSLSFWQTVESLHLQFKSDQRWLKNYGLKLYNYNFIMC